MDSQPNPRFTNRTEYDSFMKNAFAWHGSITPVVLPRVVVSLIYTAILLYINSVYDLGDLEQAPFEFSGIALGVILVFRLNAGYDRWWEARKWWGSIVNQSRNIAISTLSYSSASAQWKDDFIALTACLPYVFKNSLRGQKGGAEYERIVGKSMSRKIVASSHMPSFTSREMGEMLAQARRRGEIDGYAFIEIEKQRALLIDAIGACERILKTPVPLVIAINTRRFILTFLILLPFAVIPVMGWASLIAVAVISYAFLSLDQIGIELQNPFDPANRSHLPLSDICSNIATNVLSLKQHGDASGPRPPAADM